MFHAESHPFTVGRQCFISSVGEVDTGKYWPMPMCCCRLFLATQLPFGAVMRGG
jgi:hypothetical protein